MILLMPSVGRAFQIELEITVLGHWVEYDVTVCRETGDTTDSVWVDLFFHSPSAPPQQNSAGNVWWVYSGSSCFHQSVVRQWVPNGYYQAWVQVNSIADPSVELAVLGPEEYRVGPDLWIASAGYEIDGATLKYKARVCNIGTDVARNFRVGFYYDYPQPGPPDGIYSDKFKAIEKLDFDHWWWWRQWHIPYPVCVDVEHERHQTPNDRYISWIKVDSGQFVVESNEDNNLWGPMVIDMSNPDIVIEAFEAEVTTNKPYTVEYYVRAKNVGTRRAKVFWIDIYHDREPADAPQLGEPGEVQIRVDDLDPQEIVEAEHTWRPELKEENKHCSNWIYDCNEPECRDNPDCLCDPGNEPCLDKHWVYRSWVQADSDEFLVDPDRSTNRAGALEVRVPRGALPEGCEDKDGDGFGIGQSCTEQQDCDDDIAAINPGAAEECGDGIDNDCDGNTEECCDGVDCCEDGDVDGSPVGSDCDLPDCDDEDPERSPVYAETCGDGIDNDCDGIVDDCCEGVNCCDADNDGFGVGTGCEGPQDCNDGDPGAGENLGEEICGDGQDNDCDGITDDCCEGVLCCDADNDGYGVGIGCPGPQDPDDDDPQNPADEETCGDGIDNDLNGIIDDPPCPCADNDGDGFCVGGEFEEDCWVTDPQLCPKEDVDCNDNDPNINPDAQEVCDGVTDENCNGTIDDAAEGQEPCLDPNCVMACATAECVAANCPNGELTCLYDCGLQNTSCTDDCPTVDCIDGDGDGWGVGPDCAWSDCNDEDETIHPEADEICDGVTDENCNGTIDDGTPGNLCPDPQCVMDCAENMPCASDCNISDADCYACGVTNTACVAGCDTVDCVDNDGDGWGVGEDCAPGTEDPDDEDPSIHPGAGEICGDGIDQNGDGVADDGCLLCIDLDRDGYGVGSHCLEPDCNDLNAVIHPRAPEPCGSGDRNCDGKLKTECDSGCAAAANGRCASPMTALFVLLALLALGARRSLFARDDSV
jgi:hypothetical protein